MPRAKTKSKSKHKVKGKRKAKYVTVAVSKAAHVPKKKSLLQRISGTVKRVAKKHAPKVLESVGSKLMGPTGAAIGRGIGKIFGSGTYRITDNSILHGSQIPEFRQRGGRHETRVRHRGFIADVSGTTTFTNTSYNINPGNATLFPWLSTLASQHEEYRIHGLVFEFRTNAANSVGSTNTSLGSVIMATEYNSTLPAYISKLQMENAEFSASCVPFDSMLHPVECKRSETVIGELYVRNSPLPQGQDQRLYDLGLFQIATTGQQAANKIGELWYSIDISFYKERYGMSAGTDVTTAHYTSSTSISTTNYFGTSQTLVAGSNFSATLTGTTVTLPANIPVGSYMVNYVVIGSSTAVTAPTIAFTNATALSIYNNAGGSSVNNTGATSTVCNATSWFTVASTASGAPVITFSGGTLPTSPTWMDLVITQINTQVVS